MNYLSHFPAGLISEQLNRLERLGMIIPDREHAAHCLRHISYHRLSSYWQTFVNLDAPCDDAPGDFIFNAGAAFSDVIRLYDFDHSLRLLLTDALSRIEISGRSQWVDQLINYPDGGSLAHFKPALFDSRQYRQNLDELERSYRKIAGTQAPDWTTAPLWEVADVMSFGQLSKWYNSIALRSIRSGISSHYAINHKIFSSLLYNMTLLRNTCAHHNLLWNRSFNAGLKIPKSLLRYCNGDAKDRLYNRLVIIAYFMDIIQPSARWKTELARLLESHPTVPIVRMGFPDNWREMEFWKG